MVWEIDSYMFRNMAWEMNKIMFRDMVWEIDKAIHVLLTIAMALHKIVITPQSSALAMELPWNLSN